MRILNEVVIKELNNEIITNCGYANLAITWFLFITFLCEKFNLTKEILDTIIIQRVVCNELSLPSNNFDSECIFVNTYLSNQSVFGPSVGNVSKYVEDIGWLNNDEKFTYTCLFMERRDCVIEKLPSSDFVTLYMFNDDDSNNSGYKLNIKNVVLPLFSQGYLCDFYYADNNIKKKLKNFKSKKSTSSKKGKKTSRNSTVHSKKLTKNKIIKNINENADFMNKTIFIALLTKTICDLSICSWVASNNQNPDNEDACFLFLTLDKTAACISSTMEGMSDKTLLQRKNTLHAPPRDNTIKHELANNLFNDKVKNNSMYKKHCNKDCS